MLDPIETRLERQRAFADQSGFANAKLDLLPGDASFRRYSRLVGGARPALVMDAPPPYENLGAYLDVRQSLEQMGMRVPALYAEDQAQGLAIIEDFGDQTFTNILAATPDREEELYIIAAKALAHLHAQTEPSQLKLAPYDMDALLAEVSLFPDWFVPEVTGNSVTDPMRQEYLAAWSDVLSSVGAKQETLVLRDYHVDNLMLVEGSSPVDRCGQLDFQDALIGSPAYDLASLIEDARRDVPAFIREAVLNAYFQGQSIERRNDIEGDLNILAAQRHTKVLGIFVRLYRRDGKSGYLRHIARLQQLLNDHFCRDDRLKPIADMTKQLCPNWESAKINAD